MSPVIHFHNPSPNRLHCSLEHFSISLSFSTFIYQCFTFVIIDMLILFWNMIAQRCWISNNSNHWNCNSFTYQEVLLLFLLEIIFFLVSKGDTFLVLLFQIKILVLCSTKRKKNIKLVISFLYELYYKIRIILALLTKDNQILVLKIGFLSTSLLTVMNTAETFSHRLLNLPKPILYIGMVSTF